MTTAPRVGEPLPVELMNTVWADRDGVHDALESSAATVAWLHAWAEPPGHEVPEPAGWSQTADLVRLRDASRRLAARQTADDRAAALTTLEADRAVEIVNALASAATSWPVLHWPQATSPSLTIGSEAASGTVFVADLARSVACFFGSDEREALRACHAPGCVLYFLKQHPRREWCSAGCGNRARVARHYRRHHG